MERRLKYRPEGVTELEWRVVLSHAAMARAASIVVSGLHPGKQVLAPKRLTITAEVNQAFAIFQANFDAARSTYFAALNESPMAMGMAVPAATAFKQYTTASVQLLAQQVISSFLQSPTGTAHAKGAGSTLKLLVSTKLIEPNGVTPIGSLAEILVDSTPVINVGAAATSLESLGQDIAIQSAQTAIINGVNILKNGDFGNKTSGHKN